MQEQIYIIGDVHGCYDTLMTLINQLPENAKLVFCGDLIDRGPKSRQVIEYIRNNNHSMVLGNHEKLMIESDGLVVDPRDFADTDWGANGGRETLASYHETDKLHTDIEWLKKQPLYLVFDNYKDKMGRTLVVSHAPCLDYFNYYQDVKEKVKNNDYTPHEYIDYKHTIRNSEMLFIWNRGIPRKEQTELFNVFGHNPVDSFIFDHDGNQKIEDRYITPEGIIFDNLKGYANIDSGAVYKAERFSKKYRGKLTALEFPSMKIFQQVNIDDY